MESKRWVKLIGDHPHAGCSGYVKVVDGMISFVERSWGKAYDVHLVDCIHGTQVCEATRDSMQLIADPDARPRGRSASARGRRS